MCWWTYNLPAAHKPTLTGAALWTDEASDPIGNIRAWKKLISQNGGPVTGFCRLLWNQCHDRIDQ